MHVRESMHVCEGVQAARVPCVLAVDGVDVSQVVARGMIARGEGGAIVNMSSTYGHIVLPDISSRCISKGALDQVTRVMTVELGPHQV